MPDRKQAPRPQPAAFLAALRNSHEHARGVYRLGGCYELFRILRTVWAEAEPWYIDGHVYSRIGDSWWDIDGRWKPTADQQRRLKPLFRRKQRPWNWRNRTAERRRGFRTRQIGTVQLTQALKWRLKVARAKIAFLRTILPARSRQRIFNAIRLRAEAEAI